MKSRTFRLEDSDVELLKQLAEERNESQSDAIRHAIRLAGGAIQGAIRDDEPDRPAAGERPGVSREAYDDLCGQLQVKDGQISDLSKALAAAQETARLAQETALAAQETAKAAQALHAIDRKEDLLQEPPADDPDGAPAGAGGRRELTRWEHFKAIFA